MTFMAKTVLTLQKLKDNLYGEDLGALRPCLKGKLLTDNQEIIINSELIMQDLKRVKINFEKLVKAIENIDFDLQLIGRRYLRSNNS